jgi:photosystem II stability/assembly factor-like uncharacterized protein
MSFMRKERQMRLGSSCMRTAMTMAILCLIVGACAYPAVAGVDRWTTNGPEGGDVGAIAVDPSNPATVYAGLYNGNGIFKSTNGGTTWSAVNVGLTPVTGLTSVSVFTLQIDPLAPQVLYAGTDQGVYKSTNGGAIWRSVGLPTQQVRGLVLDPQVPSTIYAGTLAFSGSGIFKSTDSGASWRLMNSGLNNTSVWTLAIDSSNPTVLYAGTYQGAYKSINRGDSWMSVGLESSHIQVIVLDPSHPNTVYAGSPLQGVFKTTDGGSHWAAVNDGLPSSAFIYALAIDPVAPMTVYAGVFAHGLFKSTDGGASWFEANNGLDHAIINTLLIDPGNHSTVYAGTFGGGVFKSTSSGASWLARNNGMYATQISSLAIDPSSASTAYVGTLSTGIFKTTDAGGHWTPLSTPMGKLPGQVGDMAVNPSSPGTVFAVINGPPGVFKSTNGGVSWMGANTGLTETAFSAIAIAPSAPTTMYAGSFNGKAFRSDNGGASWTLASGGLGASQIVSLAVDPVDSLVVYAGVLTAGLYKSTTGGQSWTRIGPPGSVFILSALAVDPVDRSTIYAGDIGGSRNLYKSLDGGATWVPLEGVRDVSALRIVAKRHTTLYAATAHDGVLKSQDGGANWSVVDEAGPDEVVELAISGDGSILYEGARKDGGVYVFTDANIPPCVRDANTACLLGGRFEVEVDWRTASASGSGQVMTFGGQRAENTESVFWWFFGSTNFEMGVKVLNACAPSLGNKFWVFMSGLTNQGWTVRVRDTQTGATRSYENSTGQLSNTFADTAAFNCP